MCEDDNDNLLLLNTYTNDLYTFKGESKTELKKYIKDSSCSLKYLEYLKNEQIIVEEKVDENARAEFQYLQNAHSNNKLLLTILPTEDCNFRCPYCYESHNKGRMSESVINGIKEYIKKNLVYYKKLQVSWFGGEPLEELEIVKELSEYFISECAKQKKPYTASMTTNGYNLDLETFKILLRLHVIDYQITVDGFEHDNTRFLANGEGTFKKIVTNLKNIKENIASSSFNITIRTNITKSVIKNIKPFINFLDSKFGNDNRFGVIFKIVWSNNQDTEFNRNELLPTGDLKKVLDYCIGTNLKFYINRGQICSKNGICYAAHSNAFVIGSDGNIYKCTVEFDKEINKIGKLHKEGKMILDMDKFLFWTMKTPFKEDKKCYECFFQPACMGVYCPMNRFDENGNHRCVGMKDYVDVYMKLCARNRDLVKEVNRL